MKLFGKIIKIIAVVLIAVFVYFMTLHYRREPFIYSTCALKYFMVTENRLPNDVNEMLILYNKEFTQLNAEDVRMINWEVDWDNLIKKNNSLFNKKGEKIDIIYPYAIDPLLRREARRNSIYLFDIYKETKKKLIEKND